MSHKKVVLQVYQAPIAEGLPLPKYAYEGDAGLDLPVAVAVTIPPHTCAEVQTGLRIAIPRGYYIRITGKGSSAKAGLGFDLENVDQGYTGFLTLLAWNKSSEPVHIPRGKCVAQAVVTPLVEARLVPITLQKMDGVRTARMGGRMDSSKTGI